MKAGAAKSRKVVVCIGEKKRSVDTLHDYIHHVHQPNDCVIVAFCPSICLCHLTLSTALFDYDNHVRAGTELTDQVLGTVSTLRKIMADNQVRGRVEVLSGFFSSRVMLKYIKTESPHLVVVPSGRDWKSVPDDVDFKSCLASWVPFKTCPASWAGYLVRQSPVSVLVLPARESKTSPETKSCSDSAPTVKSEHGQNSFRFKRISKNG